MPPAAWPAQASLTHRCDPGSRTPTALLTATISLVLHLVLLPAPAAAVFLPQQNITSSQATYCGFYSIERYKTWCESNITAFVASNSSCQQYGVCIPLDDNDAMLCSGGTACSGWLKGGTRVAACLVLQAASPAAAAAAGALCDVEVQGPSVFDLPPPGPPSPPPPKGAKQPRDWALWKTMTIIWSILGSAALLVVAVLLIRWCMRRRAKSTSSSPVTILSPEEKSKIELEAAAAPPPHQQQGQHQRAAADATVTLRPMAPDGKPILAYGSGYPPPPPLQQMTNVYGSPRLPPNAGDALLQAAADSRAAYNGPPMRTAPVTIPALAGVTPPPPEPAPDAAAASAAAAAAVAAAAAIAGFNQRQQYGNDPSPDAAGLQLGTGAGQGVAAALVPFVTPAALVPPAAATLSGPR